MSKKSKGYRKCFKRAPKGCRLWRDKGIPRVLYGRKTCHAQHLSTLNAHLSDEALHPANQQGKESGFLGFDVPPLSECHDQPQVATARHRFSDSFDHEMQHLVVSLTDCRVTYPLKCMKSTLSANKMRPMRVIALFDGISTALYVLDKLGIQVEIYYSCEIDSNALRLQKYNYNDRIKMLGSVTTLTNDKLDSLGRVDLVLGGSPCNDLSLVNPRRRGLYGPGSSGRLFFEFHRILSHLTAIGKKNQTVLYWLFENTVAMEKQTQKDISRYLKCDPVFRCASDYLPMKRKRFFWGNIPAMYEPRWKCTTDMVLQDLLRPLRHANVKILPTLTTSVHSQRSGRDKILPVTENGMETPLLITEQELVFGFHEDYTHAPNLSLTDRRKLLGRAWCVPVVANLLQPLTDFFCNMT